MNQLIAIVGPTAIGKSRLAVYLASRYNGEIVNADSRQVYRFMDIGTAKPGPEDLALVPHHLINIINPDEDFSLAQYRQLANSAIKDIQKRERLPILVGGSGQYVWSILENWGLPGVPPDKELRRKMQEKAEREGTHVLYQELKMVDPEAARDIDPANLRRIIRALEVYRLTNVPFSQLRRKKEPEYRAMIIGLTTDRETLYRRIDARVNRMLETRLLSEIEGLVNMGYGFELPAMSSIGYKQIGMYLKGETTLSAAIQQTKFETHRFARQQYTWFKLNDERIGWFNIHGEGVEKKIMASSSHFLENTSRPQRLLR